MTIYPFDTIYINGRTVSLDEIRSGMASIKSDFELHTFKFIKDWLNGVETYSLNTSGSTGTPKEITVTRKQIIGSVSLTQHSLGLKSGFNALVCLDTKYIAGKMMLARSLEIGMKILAVTPTSNPLEKITTEFNVDFTAFVPLQVQAILGSPTSTLFNTMKTILIGGAPINPVLQNQIQKIKPPVYATYGMTETISHIALQRLNGPNAQEYFQALPSIQLRSDERSCLVIHAPYLPKEIITNDVVEIIAQNKFKWIGRWDNIINSGGVKIVPEQVEVKIDRIFSSLNIDNRHFISGMPDLITGTRVILIIEGDLRKESENIYQSYLEKNLSKSERPRNIYFLNSFDQTENGKINRKACLERLNP